MAGEADLEEDARILEIVDAAGRREHVPRRAAERVDDELRRRLRDARPLAGADLDEPHLAQMEQRLADGGAADAELAHQVALGGKLVARRVVAVMDHALEMVGDLLVELAAADDGLHHLGIPMIPAVRTLTVTPSVCQREPTSPFKDARPRRDFVLLFMFSMGEDGGRWIPSS